MGQVLKALLFSANKTCSSEGTAHGLQMTKENSFYYPGPQCMSVYLGDAYFMKILRCLSMAEIDIRTTLLALRN